MTKEGTTGRTQRPQNEGEREDPVRAFYNYTGRVRALEELANEYDAKQNEENVRANLSNVVYEEMGNMGMKRPDSAAELDVEDAKDYVFGKDKLVARIYQNATDTAITSLDDIIASADDEKLEGLVGSEEGKKIAANADPEYREWLAHYLAYRQNKDLYDKAQSNNLDDKERKELLKTIIANDTENVRNKLREMGKSEAKQDAFAAFATKAAILYSKPEDYSAVAEQRMNDAEEALRGYEEESGKDIRGYVGSAIGRMLQKPRKISREAINYLDAIKA